jgi:hypothetical protein
MLIALSKHRPKDCSVEEFEKIWNNIGYSLAPLYQFCQEEIESTGRISKEDFDTPNHYAKMAYEAGVRAALEKIQKILPESAKTP